MATEKDIIQIYIDYLFNSIGQINYKRLKKSFNVPYKIESIIDLNPIAYYYTPIGSLFYFKNKPKSQNLYKELLALGFSNKKRGYSNPGSNRRIYIFGNRNVHIPDKIKNKIEMYKIPNGLYLLLSIYGEDKKRFYKKLKRIANLDKTKKILERKGNNLAISINNIIATTNVDI